MFAASIAEPNTTAMFIGDIAKFINQTRTTGPLSDLYDVNTGYYPSSPVFVSLKLHCHRLEWEEDHDS